MAGEKNAGSIVYEISADVEPLLQGGKQAIDAFDKLDAAAQQSARVWITWTKALRKPDPHSLNWLVMPTRWTTSLKAKYQR